MERTICIIGGGGFIGTALRHSLAAAGYRLVTIGRSPAFHAIGEQERYYSIAEYSYKELESLVAGAHFSAVIDLAYTSVPNTSFDDPVRDFSENLYNVIRHLDFARAVQVGKYIYVSSGGTVYGESAPQPIREDAQNFPLSPYGITKMACERYVNMYHRIYGLHAVIVRPSNIYGPGQRPFRGQGLISTALGLAAKNEPVHVFGNGESVRDYLYIDDFCAAMLDVIQYSSPGEIYNIGNGEGHTITEILDSTHRILREEGLQPKRVQLPERPYDVHFNVLNIDKISGLNGWKPRNDLDVGIRATWSWIQNYLQSEKNTVS